ncbi:hypothetical protein [Thauera linaloolentis]|uniref:Uncharacterized protein n=1 Tax=Thauera linaloolentis (strain DSM 12138 / JCM 21573 / CCUG 41526 / CIP 105981 / IAM 15112 / NBRC 102519 / 47Lol) TaxID=1123367 RepID=N6YT21_THAL4|nr:hypothetical protein [Thauera linaloolentis]ENO85318.1 hypothetical protein C666_15585 [Thauera linaloolentis 47Lol = DSM 12138]MCM8565957.1 pilus assembly protein [Thauera linaloolentis]
MKPIPFRLPSIPPRQRGAGAVSLLLFIGAATGIAAYAVDSSRTTASAAQLKHATDAAAMAVTMAHARDDTIDTQSLAEKYVHANLGMDGAQFEQQLDIALETVTRDDADGFRVSATFRASSLLGNDADVTVSSAAVARNKSLEVALAIPNTLSENAANLAALRRLGKRFAENLIGNRDNTWLALVPYSQAVSVYDARQANRIRNWAAPGALNPVELTSLFRTGYAGLADRRIPDRRANLLCMYRGLDRGENYFWDEAPAGQFKVYYRHDLPENGSPGAPPISWVGPNPDFGQATGVNDTRWMTADRGCPNAALLPLTNDLDEIDTRLDQMSTRFNVNYAIAMGWSAMALAPEFRGPGGWGLENDLPRDFDEEGGDTVKAIVLLVNSSDQRWFDSDAYNAWVGEKIDGDRDLGSRNDPLITERFANLCRSFRERRLRFFLIVTGSDEAEDEDGQIASASEFRRVAGPGLQRCAERGSDLTYLSGYDFVASEGRIESRLDAIIDELRLQSNFARLVE